MKQAAPQSWPEGNIFPVAHPAIVPVELPIHHSHLFPSMIRNPLVSSFPSLSAPVSLYRPSAWGRSFSLSFFFIFIWVFTSVASFVVSFALFRWPFRRTHLLFLVSGKEVVCPPTQSPQTYLPYSTRFLLNLLYVFTFFSPITSTSFAEENRPVEQTRSEVSTVFYLSSSSSFFCL